MRFPFIRFTNWKQENFRGCNPRGIKRFHSYASRIGSKGFPLAGTGIAGCSFHSYASRIGSKPMLAGSLLEMNRPFPFIRFTNWKQVFILNTRIRTMTDTSFHSYASRIGSKKNGTHCFWKDPFTGSVSIHTLHELEASNICIVTLWNPKSFHSYASRIGSKNL